MNDKVIYLYKHIDRFGGYMVTFIESMYRHVQKRGIQAEFSHTAACFIERAYKRLT